MQQKAGTHNSTTLVASIAVIILVALGVWWASRDGAGHSSTTGSSSPAAGQLQGTVR